MMGEEEKSYLQIWAGPRLEIVRCLVPTSLSSHIEWAFLNFSHHCSEPA